MLAVLLEASIRATLLIAAVAWVLWLMRIRTASVRHAVWAGVVVTMLVLPLTVAWGPKVALRWLPAEPVRVVTPVVVPSAPISSPEFIVPSPVPQVAGRTSWTWENYVGALYFLGLAVFLLRLGVGTAHVQRLMRGAVLNDGQRTHASCATPITVGCVTPMVILPPHWAQWPHAQLSAVLAHEQAHVSRRDPLFQYVGLLNRAIFWFHPLAWWLDRQLSGLAEEACDDVVLSQGYDPREYSEYLVSIARSLDEHRVEMIGMAMPGVSLPQRVKRMLAGVAGQRTSRLRIIATGSLVVAMVAMLSTGSLARAEHPVAGSARPPATLEELKPPARTLIAQSVPPVQTTTPPVKVSPADPAAAVELVRLPLEVESVKGPTPKFEVASVKLNKSGTLQANVGMPPDGVNFVNLPLRGIIQLSFGVNQPSKLVGVPDWTVSERFDINAKAAGPISADDRRLMLQELLAERFKLVAHPEKREVSVVTVKLARSDGKLGSHMIASTGCVTGAAVEAQKDEPAAAQKPVCGPKPGGAGRLILTGVTAQQLASYLALVLGRTVGDKTGLTGSYDIDLSYAPERAIPAEAPIDAADPNAPSIYTALREQLGLVLDTQKDQEEVLVIDSLQRQPTEN